MDWSELMQLIQDGHEIGSHTMSHAVLGLNQTNHMREEICGSKTVLESHLGRPVTTFSYPTGAFCAEALQQIATAGYESAVTTIPGCNSRQIPLNQLCRINLQADQNQSVNGNLNSAVLSWRIARVSGGC